VQDIKAGDVITEDNVKSIRPGYGLAPKHWDEIVGKVAKVDILRGTALSLDKIEFD
jgi:N-acetylneuraminate synthase